MSQEKDAKRPEPKAALSLDTWAVVLAFLLAVLVKMGVIHRVAW